MKLHAAKSKQKQFYHINTESSSWKIPIVTIATFWIYTYAIYRLHKLMNIVELSENPLLFSSFQELFYYMTG